MNEAVLHTILNRIDANPQSSPEDRVNGYKVDCIWFKSLDCGGTIALLTTHCSSSYSVAQCSTQHNKLAHTATKSGLQLFHDSHCLSDKTLIFTFYGTLCMEIT